MHTPTTRILVESTGTFGTRVNTGIQRVVRSLVREARRAEGERALSVVPVIFRNGAFYDATAAWTRIIRWQDRGGHPPGHWLNVALERCSPGAARLYAATLKRLRKLLYPKSLVRKASSIYWHTAGRPITFHEDDVLLLLDASWGHPLWPAVRDASRQGCRVGAVMYDLLPVEHPQFFQQPFSAVFTDWLENLIDHSEFFLAISETVRASLEAYVRSSRPTEVAAAKRFHSFRLGADMPRSPTPAGVRPALRQLFCSGPGQAPYLAVGTIEPRKNHHYLLDAFEPLWRDCPSARLCLVGRIGWKCRDVLDRIARHPQTGTSLFVFHDLGDDELQFCYERSKALLTASHAEGFGLPIVEALGHALPVFASDIPVHREVGGSHCRYFHLPDTGSLTKLLRDFEQHGTPRSVPRSGTGSVITWSECCRDLLTKTLQLQSRASAEVPPAVDGRAPTRPGRTRAA